MSHYHTQADPKDDPNQRRAAVDRFLNPAATNAERNEIIERWKVGFVAVKRSEPPALIRELRLDPRLREVYSDPPNVPGYASLIVWQVV
jgi:hypothetical protein